MVSHNITSYFFNYIKRMYNVSFYKSIADTKSVLQISIDDFLVSVKDGTYKTLVENIRNAGNKKTQTDLKKLLPNITTSGTFTTRTDKDLLTHSGLIQIDFDKDKNPLLNIVEDKIHLSKDVHSFAVFISPTGAGLKVIVKINPTQQKEIYKELEAYYKTNYALNLDSTCSNLSRAMFVSHDKDLHHNKKSEIFILPVTDPVPTKKELPPDNLKNKLHHPKTVIECWEFTEQQQKYIEGNRNVFLRLFVGNTNRAGISVQDAEIFALSNANGLSDAEIKTTVKSAYNNVAEFGKHKFDEANKKAAAPIFSDEKTLQKIEGLYRRLNDSEGKFKDIVIHQSTLLELIASFGFRRFDIENEYIFVKIDNNILEQISQVVIQDTVIDFLRSLPDALPLEVSKAVLLEKIRKGRETYFSKGFFSMLKNEKKFIFCTDTKDISFVFYKNGFVKCTKNGIEFLPYNNLIGYVWKKQILNRDFSHLANQQYEAKIFERFMLAVCNKDLERFSSLKSLVGYLLHNYFETKLKAVVFTDSTISDEANGRTGKTLLGKAMALIKPTSEINGKEFDPADRFKYQKVKYETQVIILNDLKRGFSVENLFNDITEMVKVELKNQAPFEIKSKFLLSTNRTLKIENASAKDRFIEFEFSDYYTEKYSPEMDLGKWLFGADFTKMDWLEFDNFMMQCVCHYLQNGLIQANTINLHRRKLIEQTNSDFVNWFDGMIEDGLVKHLVEWDKKLLHDTFLNSYPDYKENKYLKLQKNFSNCLVSYTKYSDILEPFNEITDTRKSMEQRFILFRFKVI